MKLSAPIFRLKRQARLLSRETKAPLHASLDALAVKEGFRNWGHLSASIAEVQPSARLFADFEPGDLVLLAARPGHGKTALALELVVEALRAGGHAQIFTLEETGPGIAKMIEGAGDDPRIDRSRLYVDTSDLICADYIVRRSGAAGAASLIVVDYLQLLDQRRENARLAEQVAVLAAFARSARTTIVVISQIDRAFDLDAKGPPGLGDVRLPNPVDLSHFTKACFVHDGSIEVTALD